MLPRAGIHLVTWFKFPFQTINLCDVKWSWSCSWRLTWMTWPDRVIIISFCKLRASYGLVIIGHKGFKPQFHLIWNPLMRECKREYSLFFIGHYDGKQPTYLGHFTIRRRAKKPHNKVPCSFMPTCLRSEKNELQMESFLFWCNKIVSNVILVLKSAL